MNELTSKQKLLSKSGAIANPGWGRHMYYMYDREQVKSENRLKEWDFYQIHFGHIVLQLTMGHISYASSISATLIDLDKDKRRTIGKQMLFRNVFYDKMPTDPENPNVLQYFSPNLMCQFETTDKNRRLSFTYIDKKGLRAEIDVSLTNVSPFKDKMVIATPFAKKNNQFYLNYKENCFVVNGKCRIDDMSYQIRNGFGLLDWGRGVWPYKHSWVWGNGGTVVDGKHFGFNIGWGFGDTSAATENAFFYDNKIYKLGVVEEVKLGDEYRYVSEDKRFVFDVEMLYDNYTQTKAVIVNNSCHQRFGLWCGYVVLDDGQRLYVPPFIAFCEHANNKW